MQDIKHILKITEQTYLWDTLKNSTRPIVIYGMGLGGLKTLNKCHEHNIPVQVILAGDEYSRAGEFAGYKVLRYSDVVQLYPNCIILLAFGTEKPEMLGRFYELDRNHTVYAPDFALFGAEEFTPSFLQENLNKMQTVYETLADEQSRKVFTAICNYKLSGKLHYLQNCETQRLEDYRRIFNLATHEVYLDLGAYNGDTIREFLHLTQNSYQEIIALEPDCKNFAKLQKWLASEPLEHITLLNEGIWDSATTLSFATCGGRQSALSENGNSIIHTQSIDNLAQGRKLSLIKMDVEGSEQEALLGGAHTLAIHKPKLMIAAYHKSKDIFHLPLLIHKLNPEYKIYLRKHPYVPAWEINIFAI